MTVVTRVSAAGGTPVPVTHLSAAQGSHRWPQFLPDGRRFVFISVLGRADTNGVYLGFLDGRDPIKVLAADRSALFHPPNTLLFVRQGVLHAVEFHPDSGLIAGEEVPIADGVGTDGTIARSAFTISETGVEFPGFSGGSVSVVSARPQIAQGSCRRDDCGGGSDCRSGRCNRQCR